MLPCETTFQINIIKMDDNLCETLHLPAGSMLISVLDLCKTARLVYCYEYNLLTEEILFKLKAALYVLNES